MTEAHGSLSAKTVADEDLKAAIFDIQRFSVHDGPGIRTLVFFKGCPLHCEWCSNPESHSAEVELALFPGRCIGCDRCIAVCPNGAVSRNESGHLTIDRDLCRVCGTCSETCFADARVLLGREVTVGQVMNEVRKDVIFYETSGGGVTLGGGEVTAWPAFAEALLATCRSEGIHTAIETCGHAPWEELEALVRHTNIVLYDIKHMDPAIHEQFTGVSNALILDNFSRLAAVESGPDIVVRVPVIPGFNNETAAISDIARFVHKHAREAHIELLPYHRLGEDKYERLGRQYALRGLRPPEAAVMVSLAEAARAEGLTVQIGG